MNVRTPSFNYRGFESALQAKQETGLTFPDAPDNSGADPLTAVAQPASEQQIRLVIQRSCRRFWTLQAPLRLQGDLRLQVLLTPTPQNFGLLPSRIAERAASFSG